MRSLPWTAKVFFFFFLNTGQTSQQQNMGQVCSNSQDLWILKNMTQKEAENHETTGKSRSGMIMCMTMKLTEGES